MIALTTAWYVWALLIALIFVFGACVGQWDAHREARRRARRRNDDASRFDEDQIITLSDGSWMRVVSTHPATQRQRPDR